MGEFTDTFTREQERDILSLYVTSPFEDIFFVYDTIPPEQFAMLAASYSRTHEPFQQRLLKSIESGDLELPKIYDVPNKVSEINNEELREECKHLIKESKVPEEKLMGFVQKWSEDHKQNLYQNLIKNWSVPPVKARKFVEKWAQGYGHNSVKEAGNTRFVCENIPDLTGKLITGHPLAHPQVKSSRYIDWGTVLKLSENNLDIANSKHAELMIKTIRELGESYGSITDRLESFAKNHPLNQEYLKHSLDNLKSNQTHEKVEKAFEADSRKSMLDYSRYLLTPSMSTSLGCSIDVRSLEEVVTNLLSSPLKQDNQIGQKIWDEAKKSVPVLMGDKCHAKKSEYIIQTRKDFEELLPKLFDFENKREFEITKRTNFIDEDTKLDDLFIAASTCWQYGNGSFDQYYKELQKDEGKIEKVINNSFKHRGEFDPLPNSLLIRQPAFETLMDYGGDRDNHRHRRDPWLRQILTTEHGFETPEIIHQADLNQDYEKALNKTDEVYKKIREDDPHTAQLIVPFAYKCRRLLSWSTGQQGYYTELRSKKPGHDSYRSIAWDIAGEMEKRTPLVAKHIKVDTDQYPSSLIKTARKWYDQEKR